MILNLKAHTIYAIHLRAASSSGGKDWVGSVTTQGEIHTFWGKTNQINQHAAKPGDLTALRKIISQKQHGKYTQVDEYNPQQGWQSQRDQSTTSTAQLPAPAAVPIVDWYGEAPVAAIQWDF